MIRMQYGLQEWQCSWECARKRQAHAKGGIRLDSKQGLRYLLLTSLPYF